MAACFCMLQLVRWVWRVAWRALLARCWTALRLRLVLLSLLPVCAAAAAFALLRYAAAIIASPALAWRLAISHDQLANAAANGDPDETISSRANRARLRGRSWGCILCRALDWFDPNHCPRSAGM